ncbi:MAG: WD40/YVTN/BNR-like repeat-containing protein [Planctomycetota bacterium]|jgi:photosystem II stability/assembly factor-like uncharacterized protein
MKWNEDTRALVRAGRSVRLYSGSRLIYGHGEMPVDEAAIARLLSRKKTSYDHLIKPLSERRYNVMSSSSIAALEHIHRYGEDVRVLEITSDAGKTWAPRYVSSRLVNIHFLDRNMGWACGTSGRMSRTADGGDSWVHTFLPTDANLSSVFFLDAKTGWLAGSFKRHASHGLTPSGKSSVWRTDDGGGTWRKVAETENGRKGAHEIPEYVDGFFFRDTDTGWAVTHGTTKDPQPEVNGCGPREYGRVLMTEDGGVSWSQVYYGAPLADLASRNGVFLAAGYRIVRSADGRQWRNVAPGGPSFAVAFADDTHCVAVGEIGPPMISLDAGMSWVRPDEPLFHRTHLDAVAFGSAQVGWIGGSTRSGQHSGLFKTADGTKTWRPAAVDPTTGGVNYLWADISAVDTGHAWAVRADVMVRLQSMAATTRGKK